MKRAWFGAPLVASTLFLAGCMGAPTYGTDKTSTEQLASDLTGIVSIAPKRREPIDYKPRPELVKPAPGARAELPVPQDSVTVASNPSWPESPEQRRARIRAEVTANQDNPNYDSPIVPDVATASATPSSGGSSRGDDSGSNQSINRPEFRNTRAAYKKRVAENRQGSATSRKYLSEPPLTYRQPAATAAADDIGVDEFKKERRAKAAARKKGSGWSLKQLIPGM
ncbi:hypothetical protein [Mesorhizobium sp. NBSH29]|uniref:hypothetical protein n=1 Tax=Mesorhizobium sp. NBSH29 TaxID=2654249 RepID=UPI0035BC6475